MRKCKLLLSTVLLGILLTACGGQTQTTTEKQTGEAQTEASSEEPGDTADASGEDSTEQTQTSQGNMVIDFEYHNCPDEIDTEYFWGYYDLPKLLSDEYGLLKAALDSWAVDYEDTYIEHAKEFSEDAKQYAEEAEDFYGYSYYTTMKATRADERVACIAVNETTYMGGAHGGSYLYGVCFDSQTGARLKYSDLGDITQDVTMYLQDYFTDYPSDLFSAEECMDIVREKLGNDDAWYLAGEGLAIVFNEYEINSYAAGRSEVLIPYSELQGFNTAYLPVDGIGFTQLQINNPLYVDLNGDGDYEAVTISTFYSEESTDIQLKVGDLALSFDAGEYVEGAYFIRTKDKKCYGAVTIDMASDDYVTYLVDITDGVPKKCDEVEGNIGTMSNEQIYINCRLNVLGTYFSRQPYAFTGGKFEMLDTIYRWESYIMNNDSVPGPTLKQPLKALVGASENDTLVEEELPAGTIIYPCMYDGESKVGFFIEDGRYGELTIQWKDGRAVIDGVDEWDLFDNLPYAG